ncbi:MAG: septation protein IspZ [Gammaproteobacteria bacterium]|nr:septation protein IspZ [Gammaproteobacteria bacterium]
MDQLLGFVPIVLFVAVFFLADIYYATAALMIAVSAQVVIYLLLKKPISRELKLTFWLSIIFGGLTLIFRNELFIQWKPTVINWALSGSLITSHFIGKRNLIEHLLGKQLTLVDEVWAKLNFGWAFGLFLAGALNLVVAYNFSMEFWVSYKLIGGFSLTFIYILITMAYLAKKGFLDDNTDGIEIDK